MSNTKRKGNRPRVLGIYQTQTEGGELLFTNEYAVTEFEAQKHCVETCRQKLLELGGYVNYNPDTIGDDSHGGIKVLWFGQTPPVPGFYLIYGLPGPNKSKIDIIKYEKGKGWLSEYNIFKKLFSIEYRPIYRVKVEVEENIVKGEVVKCSPEVIESIKKTYSETIPSDLGSSIKNFDKSKLRTLR